MVESEEYLTPEEEEAAAHKRVWYVLHVKPRTEKQVMTRLEPLGVFHYLPLLKKVRKVQRRKVVRYLPLFPGYVFTRLNADERRTMLMTQMIVRTIRVAEPRRMIHQLRQINLATSHGENVRVVNNFTVNEHVRIKTGPFRGVDGYVKSTDRALTLVLVVEVLGSAIEMTISPADLEKISD